MRSLILLCLLVASTVAQSVAAMAATATSTFTVSITLQASCVISSTGPLAFGNQGVLNSAVNASSTLGVQCTSSTPFNVGLNAGATAGATTTTRLLSSGANTVGYKIYSDSGRTSLWGNTVGTDTVSQTGTGAVQNVTLYGQVPAQATPAPGSYSDTVTVTITY